MPQVGMGDLPQREAIRNTLLERRSVCRTELDEVRRGLDARRVTET
jgi:hypothetical protein